MTDSREGLLLGGGAFALWGLYPFYFKALGDVPPLEIVAHRIFWSTLVLAPLIQWRRGWPAGHRRPVRPPPPLGPRRHHAS